MIRYVRRRRSKSKSKSKSNSNRSETTGDHRRVKHTHANCTHTEHTRHTRTLKPVGANESLNPPPSTPYPQPSTLNPQPSTRNLWVPMNLFDVLLALVYKQKLRGNLRYLKEKK